MNISHLESTICQKKWDEVITRCKIYPKEASHNDGFGYTMLHLALRYEAPIEVIYSFIEANPNAVRTSNQGRLPLHYACFLNCEIEIIRALFEAYPDGCLETDSLGWTPLHLCCVCNVRINVLCLLLSHDTSATLMRSNDCETPMMKLKREAGEYLMEYVDKMCILVQAAYLKRLPRYDKSFKTTCSSLFHSLASIGPIYPKYFFKTCLRIFLEYTQKKDDSENLPIHVAALYKPENGWNEKEIDLILCNKDEKWVPKYGKIPNNFRRKSSFQLLNIYYIAYIIDELLNDYPEGASIKNSKGKLALHLCLETSGIHWKRIFWNNKSAIYIKDPENNLYPFMIAGMYNHLNCCYELLRFNPNMVTIGIPVERRETECNQIIEIMKKLKQGEVDFCSCCA